MDRSTPLAEMLGVFIEINKGNETAITGLGDDAVGTLSLIVQGFLF